jgi:hypothetical protein
VAGQLSHPYKFLIFFDREDQFCYKVSTERVSDQEKPKITSEVYDNCEGKDVGSGGWVDKAKELARNIGLESW